MAITPGQGQSCKHRIFVLLHAGDKRFKCFEMAGFHLFEPCIKLVSCTRQPPCAETFLPGGMPSQRLGLPAEVCEDAPAPLPSNQLACEKRARSLVARRGPRADWAVLRKRSVCSLMQNRV